MKKLLLFIALYALALSGTAQTIHKVQGIERADLIVPQVMNRTSASGTGIDLDSIQYWVGDGNRQAAMAVKWHDVNGHTNVYVWGYRWQSTDQKTGADMIAAISAADPRFYTLIYGGTTIWDTALQDSVYAGNVIGGIGYNPSITYSTQQDIRVVFNGTTPYSLTYGAYDCQNYSFDDWTTTPTGGFWNSGWYSDGYWSYWNADGIDCEFEYASMGCSSRTLDNGCVDGWSFAYGMTWNPTMDGTIVYVMPPTQCNNTDQINRKCKNASESILSKIVQRSPSELTKHTVSSIQEMADAIESAESGDIIEFDASLKGQVIEWPKTLFIFIRNKCLTILGNGVVISNGNNLAITSDAEVTFKDVVFDGNIQSLLEVYSEQGKFGVLTIENCIFRNLGNCNAPAINISNTEVLSRQYDINIINCLFENSKIKNANDVYKEGMIKLSGYRNHNHDFKVTMINNTFRGIKASKNSCINVGNNIDIILINNVFEELKNTKSGVDINIGVNAYLTSAYNVISGTINPEYESRLSETDKWAVDLETSLELIDGKYNVEKGSPAYQNLPANTVIESVKFPTTDLYGNTIDYTKPVNAGCSQLVYAPVVPVDYTNGTFILNEDWFGHQNSTMNFLTAEGEMIYRVIQRENEGVELGCTAQYGTIYGDKLYITSKQEKDGGAKITGGRLTIADAKTLKVEKQFQTISANGYKGKADGRAFLGVNEHKGYMGTSNGIFILDLDKLEFTDYIKVPNDDEDLYTGQVGNMVRAGDYVFANHQNAGLLIINPETDKISQILKPNGELVSTMTLANDGKLWLMSGGKLVKLDPNTLEYNSVDVPEGVGLTSESWGAWRASTFCASRQENVLYWATGEGWGDICPSVRKYDIDKNEFSTFIDFSDEDWKIYGSGFRIDPVTDEAIVCLFKTYGDNSYITRKYNAQGEKIFELAMEKNYWFPALPIYPDNADPVVSELEPQTLYEGTPMEISLADLATDADNMTAAIVKTVKAVSDESVLTATITNGTLVITPLQKGTATVTIQVNSNGKLAESDILVEVIEAKSDIATFEDLTLKAESAWYGDESGEDWFDGLGYQQRFKSGDYSFKNVCMPDWDSWVGFAYSNKTATTYTAISDQFNSCVGSGNNGSANYCVAYPDGTMWGDSFSVKVESGAKTVPGFYITNSAWVVKSILEGDGMTPGAFAQDDYFKIIVHALDADGNETATREFYLADYRYDDETKRYCINDWQYVDLSRMGEAAEFTFTFDSSRKNSYGITTPAYFCIDDFGAEGKEEEHEQPTSVSTVISDNADNSNAAMYNLSGVRVNKHFKGIVIKNGRKFVR